MTTSLAQSAAREWFLFTMRIKNAADIVAWADSVIQKEEKPDIRVIELSTTPPARTDVFMSELDRLKEGADIWWAVRESLGAVHDYVATYCSEAPRIAGALYNFACWYPDKMPVDFSFIHRFDDAFALAEDGSFSSVEVVTSEFIVELKKHMTEPNRPVQTTAMTHPSSTTRGAPLSDL